MKKLTLLLSAMLFSMMSFAAVVTFDADTDKGNAGTDSNNAAAYTITKDGVTVTVSSGILGTYNNESHYRIYKSQTLTVTSTAGAITSVEFTCTAKNDAKYGPGCFTWSVGDYSYSDAVGTWTGSAAEVVFTASSNQVRATQVVVAIDGDVIPDNGGDDNGGDDNGGTVTPPVDPGKTTIEIPAEAQGWNIPAEAIDVLQARAICAGLESGATTGTKYYVMGYVKKLHAKHESGVTTYGNAQFFMENVKGADSMDDFMAYQVYGLNGEKITDPSVVEVGDFVVVYGELTNYNGTYETVGKGAAYIWNSTNTKIGAEPELPTDLIGDGTEANPYTVEDVIKLNSLSKGPHYVRAYIVGQVAGKSLTTGAEFTAPFSTSTDSTTYNTNLLVASTLGETDVTKCLPVQLPSGDLRKAFNLPENPDMHGKEVLIYGNLEAYFSVPGIKSPKSIELLDANTVTIKDLTHAEATYYEGGTYNFLLYAIDEAAEDFKFPLVLFEVKANSKTSINGTYNIVSAMYVTSLNDDYEYQGISMDQTVAGQLTVQKIDNDGNYSFNGSFVGEDGMTYKVNQVVNVYAQDENYDEIALDDIKAAVENVFVEKTASKVMNNGQLYIIRGENIYNVLGTLVK